MRRYSVCCVAEKQDGAANKVEIIHDIDCYASTESEMIGIAKRHVLDILPGYAIRGVQVLEIR